MAGNILESGVEIEGTIKFASDLIIDCKVTGEIESESGKLTLNPNADVKGDVKAGEVMIHGKVDGSIRAQKCQLKGTADVKGDLAYKSLGMEEGAKMIGSTEMIS